MYKPLVFCPLINACNFVFFFLFYPRLNLLMVFTEGDYFLAWYGFGWACVATAVGTAFGMESGCQIKM